MNSPTAFVATEIKDVCVIAAATYTMLLLVTKVVIPVERKYRKRTIQPH